MSIIGLLILLVVVGVILWAVNNYVPMDAKIKQLLNIVVVLIMVVIVIVFLLNLLGIGTGVHDLNLR